MDCNEEEDEAVVVVVVVTETGGDAVDDEEDVEVEDEEDWAGTLAGSHSLRSMSMCSQRMSPMKGGALLRKSVFGRVQRSRPLIRKLLMETPSRLNSLMDQCTQATT